MGYRTFPSLIISFDAFLQILHNRKSMLTKNLLIVAVVLQGLAVLASGQCRTGNCETIRSPGSSGFGTGYPTNGYSVIQDTSRDSQATDVMTFLNSYFTSQFKNAQISKSERQSVANGVFYRFTIVYTSKNSQKFPYEVIVFQSKKGKNTVVENKFMEIPKSQERVVKKQSDLPFARQVVLGAIEGIQEFEPDLSAGTFRFFEAKFSEPHFIIVLRNGKTDYIVSLIHDALTGTVTVQSIDITEAGTTKLNDQVEEIVTQPTPSTARQPIFQVEPETAALQIAQEDRNLLPFVTESFGADYSPEEIREIGVFIAKSAKVMSNFKIILINRNNYGVRIVIEIEKDGRLFEALIQSTKQFIELLSWKQIESVSDIDLDIFTRYFPVEVDQEITQVLRNVFAKNPKFANFRSISHLEKKIDYDGVYFKVTLISSQGNTYQINFYRKPENDFNEVIQFQLVDISYDADQETQLDQVPSEDSEYSSSISFIREKYAGILKDSKMVYLSSMEADGKVFYRYNFEGANGRYEIITSSGRASQGVRIVRWEKLEDGYVQVSMSQFTSSSIYQAIKKGLSNYLSQKFGGTQQQFDNVEFRTSPYGNSYRLFFSSPMPYIVTIASNLETQSYSIIGLERIQTVPTNKYYSDAYFGASREVSLGSARYNRIYVQFAGILTQKQPNYSWANAEVLGIFKVSMPSKTVYQVLYQLTQEKFIAKFSYDKITDSISFVEMTEYKQTATPGTYAWKCSQVAKPSGICAQCMQGYVRTLGRCYAPIDGCSLQHASTCFSCEPGYVRKDYICERSPQPAAQATVQMNNRVNFVTATARSFFQTTAVQTNTCSGFRGGICQRCPYRFYLEEGSCKRVPLECNEYDTETGVCQSCYTRYYLNDNMICTPIDPLCQQTDTRGRCINCYGGYSAVKGACNSMFT